MPYSIEWRDRVVHCKFTGDVSGQDLINCNMAIYGKSTFDRIRLQIMDMQSIDRIRFSSEHVKQVAAYDRAAAKVNPRIKCALVSSDQTAHELSHIYQQEILNSPWEGKSFRTLREALRWGKDS